MPSLTLGGFAYPAFVMVFLNCTVGTGCTVTRVEVLSGTSVRMGAVTGFINPNQFPVVPFFVAVGAFAAYPLMAA
jgi:hypothetical protein